MPPAVTSHTRPVAKRSNDCTTVHPTVKRRVRVRFVDVSGPGSRKGFSGEVVAVESKVYSTGSGQAITLFHCRTQAQSIQRNHFVLSGSQLEEGASAYIDSELESTCSRAEREQKIRHDFLTRDS